MTGMRTALLFIACCAAAGCDAPKTRHAPDPGRGGTTDAEPAQRAGPPHACKIPMDQSVTAGMDIFNGRCVQCHSLGTDKKIGSGLAGVTRRRSEEWLGRWLYSSTAMLKEDDTAKQLLRESGGIRMPDQWLTPEQARQMIDFLRWMDDHRSKPRPAN